MFCRQGKKKPTTPLLIRYCLSYFISSSFFFYFLFSFPLVIFNLCVKLIFSVYQAREARSLSWPGPADVSSQDFGVGSIPAATGKAGRCRRCRGRGRGLCWCCRRTRPPGAPFGPSFYQGMPRPLGSRWHSVICARIISKPVPWVFASCL